MQAVCCGMSALSVALLYYSWRGYHFKLVEHQKTLRERVAYMLWVMANQLPEEAAAETAHAS